MPDQEIIIKYLEDKLSEIQGDIISMGSEYTQEQLDERCHDCGGFMLDTTNYESNIAIFLEKEIEWLKLKDKWIIENKEKPCPTKKQ